MVRTSCQRVLRRAQDGCGVFLAKDYPLREGGDMFVPVSSQCYGQVPQHPQIRDGKTCDQGCTHASVNIKLIPPIFGSEFLADLPTRLPVCLLKSIAKSPSRNDVKQIFCQRRSFLPLLNPNSGEFVW